MGDRRGQPHQVHDAVRAGGCRQRLGGGVQSECEVELSIQHCVIRPTIYFAEWLQQSRGVCGLRVHEQEQGGEHFDGTGQGGQGLPTGDSRDIGAAQHSRRVRAAVLPEHRFQGRDQSGGDECPVPGRAEAPLVVGVLLRVRSRQNGLVEARGIFHCL